MSNTWQLNWNKSNYDWEKKMEDSSAHIHERTFSQSLGKSSKPDKIKKGDFVYIVCNSKCIMKGMLLTGFQQYVDINFDKYCIGNINKRKDRCENKYFCTIKIISWFWGDKRKKIRHNQHTFMQPKIKPEWWGTL
tara:strand:- start:732 stop:1136 length:405 start_codon:yes stop_codon:yes gene_type:complete